MPTLTATPARIRRSIREAVYARSVNPAVLIQRPAANDGYAQIREGFFDNQADAQILLDELAGVLMVSRVREAIETDTPFGLGNTLQLVPTIPRVRAIDQSTGFDVIMLFKGVSIDIAGDRNAVELIGPAPTSLIGGSSGVPPGDPGGFLLLEDDSGILLLEDDVTGSDGLLLE